MRLERIGILLFASDGILFGDVLAGHAHVAIVVGIPQAISNHGVDRLVVSHAKTLTRVGQQVGSVAHRFHSPRDDNFRVGGLDGLGCERNRLQPGTTNFIDGEGTDLG